MKYPPKSRKTYGKSLKRIARKLGVKYVKTRASKTEQGTPQA